MILYFWKVRIKKINIVDPKYNVWSIMRFVKAYVGEVSVLFGIFTSACKDRGNVCCSKDSHLIWTFLLVQLV